MAGRTRAQRYLAAAVLASALCLTAGCGLRWETEPTPPPVADEATLQRDALAAAVDVVRTATTASPATAVRASDIAAAQLEVLGGVYVAYPDASPSPSPSPTPAPNMADAVATLRHEARAIADDTTDANLAAIAVSIDLAWAVVDAWERVAADNAAIETAPDDDAATPLTRPVAESLRTPLPLPDGSTSEAGFAPVLTTDLDPTVLSELALMHDQARFAYETMAAHVFAHERDDALDLALAHGERSDLLQAATSAPDERTTLYQLRDVDLADANARHDLAVDLERGLVARYAVLAVTAPSTDRAWLLNAAYASYLTAFEAGASADLVTALPGLNVAPS